MKGRVLVVDDDKSMIELLAERLRKRQFEVVTAQSAAEARVAFDGAEADVVVTDLNMPGQSGIQFCEWVVTNRGDTPVIVITAFGSLDTAIAAIRAGAYDFITKPFEIDVLAIALERAIRHRELRHEVKRLRTGIRAHRDSSGHDLCWHHPQLWSLVPEPIPSDINVPPGPQFMRGCIAYRTALERELPDAPAAEAEYGHHHRKSLGTTP